jgi:hypothetical protein
MNAEKFFTYLPWLRLPEEAIQQKMLDEDFSRSQISDTTPVKRQQPLPLNDAPREIQALYCDHDLSSICMLWTIFLAKPRKVAEGWHFATMAEARIVLVPSGRIEAYNNHPITDLHGDSEFLDKLAESMDAYLNALTCATMLGKHFIPGYADEPGVQSKLEALAQLCTNLAGGKDYEDFWSSVLGLP